MSRQFPSALLRSLPAAGRQASRREVLAGLGAMALGVAGCSRTMDMPDLGVDPTTTGAIRPQISVDRAVTSPDLMYASFTDEGFQLPEVPFEKVNAKFRRQIVVDPTGEAPGTIVVNLQERFLYLVQPGGDAIRYGVGIGTRRLPLVRPRQHPVRQEMAVLDAAGRDDRAQAGTGEMAQRPARRPRQSARRPRALHLQGR